MHDLNELRCCILVGLSWSRYQNMWQIEGTMTMNVFEVGWLNYVEDVFILFIFCFILLSPRKSSRASLAFICFMTVTLLRNVRTHGFAFPCVQAPYHIPKTTKFK